MFRIFSRFNALFVRPHIRGAIREYQNQLIHRVKEDIEKLHEKFKVQYADSRAAVLSLGKFQDATHIVCFLCVLFWETEWSDFHENRN